MGHIYPPMTSLRDVRPSWVCVAAWLAVASGWACSSAQPEANGGTSIGTTGGGGGSSRTGGASGAGKGGAGGDTDGGSGAAGDDADAAGGPSGGDLDGGGSADGPEGDVDDGGAPGGSGPTHARMIALDTTAAGAGVMGDVPKYPVAVILTDASFDFSQAKAKGEDIRFATVDGTPLPYAIESWDSAAKVAAVWVKVDVKGNSTQMIKMTWGDAGASDASDSHTVFDTKEGFVGVWHLNEPGSAAKDTYKDATGNLADGTGPEMTADATGDGRIGKAVLLSHAKFQSIQIPLERGPLFDHPDQMTYSVWAFAKTHTVDYQCMLSKGEGSFRIHYVGPSTTVETCLESGAGDDLCPVNSKGTKVVPGKWFHLLAVHAHPRHAIYVNGVLQISVNDNVPWQSDPTKPVSIGNNSTFLAKTATSRSFDGLLDEARVMAVPKDDNWIKLEYESQREGQKFLTFGAGS